MLVWKAGTVHGTEHIALSIAHPRKQRKTLPAMHSEPAREAYPELHILRHEAHAASQ